MYHAVRQSGYIFILESGSTLVPMSALWVALSRPMPASLVVAIEKSCSSMKRPSLTGWAVLLLVKVLVNARNSLDSLLQNRRQFAHPVLNLFSINTGVP